jgi:UDP-glucose 4-epimerase
MKLFVMGAAGRLGRAIAAEAQRQGIDIVGVDQVSWLADIPMPSCLSFHQGSLEDQSLLDRLLPGCDGVINAAGLHGGDLPRCGMDQFIHANVELTARLITAAQRHGVKAVALSSTMEVLMSRTSGPDAPTILDEEGPLRCDSPYSASKYLMEQLGRLCAHQTGLSISSLRFMAFGYGAENAGGPKLLSKLLHRQDAARAAILAATTPGLKGEVFNIGPLTPLSASDIPQALADPALVLEKYFPGCFAVLERLKIQLSSGDLFPATRIDKARRLLGWEPQWTFSTWLSSVGWKAP